MNGWISLHKKIRKHWLWDNPIYFRAWVDMLMMANYKLEKKAYKDKIITIKRGEFPASIRGLAKRWGKTPNTVIKLLNLLKSDTMIDTHTKHGFTTIKILNFGKYQTPTNTIGDTMSDTMSDTTIISNNNINKNNPPIIPPKHNNDLSTRNKSVDGDLIGNSFIIKFYKAWVPEGELVNPPTTSERKDIAEFAKGYNPHIEFWSPYLKERQERIKANMFYHTSIRSFCGGSFRDYKPNLRPNKSPQKIVFDKTPTGLFKAYCSKCGKKEFPNDTFQIRDGSVCCKSSYTNTPPVNKTTIAKPSERDNSTNAIADLLGQMPA